MAYVKQNGQWMFINEHGNAVLRIKSVCDVDIVQRPNGEVLWPKESTADLCAQAAYYQGKQTQSQQAAAPAPSVPQDDPNCAGFYIGQQVTVKNTAPGAFLVGDIKMQIVGLDKQQGLVSIKHLDNGKIENGNCYGLKQALVK